jgi:hypothetical protein
MRAVAEPLPVVMLTRLLSASRTTRRRLSRCRATLGRADQRLRPRCGAQECRIDPPFRRHYRRVLADTTLGGVQLDAGPGSSCSFRRPTVIQRGTRIPGISTSTGPTSGSTSGSAGGFTCASVRRWPEWRQRSCSSGSWRAPRRFPSTSPRGPPLSQEPDGSTSCRVAVVTATVKTTVEPGDAIPSVAPHRLQGPPLALGASLWRITERRGAPGETATGR